MPGRAGQQLQNGEKGGRNLKDRRADADKDQETRHSDDQSYSTYSGHVQRDIENRIKIDGHGKILSISFLVDGKHIVGNSGGGKIRLWRVEDGREVATPMNATTEVYDVAVSPDGRWIVSGTDSGWVTVWNGQGHDKVTEFKGHSDRVLVVDVSADGTRIATGSRDNTLSVWSPASGRRLLGPLQHDHFVVAAKFSPDGRLIATATWDRSSIRIYNCQTGILLVDIPIRVNAEFGQSITWQSDGMQLFALSKDGEIYCLDANTGKTLLRWSIHNSKDPRCIALSRNGAFIASSGDSSVSFWDTTTHKQVGFTIQHSDNTIRCMTISADGRLAMGGGRSITLECTNDILPATHFENMSRERVQESNMKAEMADLEDTVRSLRTQLDQANNELAQLRKTVQELGRDLSASSHHLTSPASPKEDNRVIGSLAKMVQQLRQEKETLTQTLRAHEQKHQCEALYAQGRTINAALALLDIADGLTEQLKANKLLMDWLPDFTNQCSSKLEIVGDDAFNVEKYDEAITAYSTILSLGPSSPNNVLLKWTSMMVISGSASKALRAATKFKLPKPMIYHAICDVLEQDGRITEAIACFRQMQSELGGRRDEQAPWELGFQRRCAEKLEKLGDGAVETSNFDKAAEHFMSILSLDGVDQTDVLIKWSKAQAMVGS